MHLSIKCLEDYLHHIGKGELALEIAVVSVGLGPVFLAPKSRFMVGNGGFQVSEQNSVICKSMQE